MRGAPFKNEYCHCGGILILLGICPLMRTQFEIDAFMGF
jgi:hypothetical protein